MEMFLHPAEREAGMGCPLQDVVVWESRVSRKPWALGEIRHLQRQELHPRKALPVRKASESHWLPQKADCPPREGRLLNQLGGSNI